MDVVGFFGFLGGEGGEGGGVFEEFFVVGLGDFDAALVALVVWLGFELAFDFEEDAVVVVVGAGAEFFLELGAVDGLDDGVEVVVVEIEAVNRFVGEFIRGEVGVDGRE